MINGELVVDNFAGGGGASTGKNESAGTVCRRANTKHEDSSRADRTITICVKNSMRKQKRQQTYGVTKEELEKLEMELN